MHVRMVLFKVPLHFVIAELISWLESAIFIPMLLNRIIGQMDEFIFKVLHSIMETRSSDIPVFIKIAL